MQRVDRGIKRFSLANRQAETDESANWGKFQRTGSGFPSHYFSTPVMTIPWTKNRWAARKRINGMMRVNKAPACINSGR
jgi:hypothetical protein